MTHPNRWDLVPYTRGLGAQLGVTNTEKFFAHFISCGPEGAAVRAPDLTDLPFEDASLDFVVMRTELSLQAEIDARRVLKDSGYLVMLHGTGGWVEPKSGGEFFSFDWQPQDVAKHACVVRYGGFGDQLQAANILPQLKREGFHVTFMTTPKGQDILREDPHVDAWFIQDIDQVPNHELPEFWKHQATHFEKFINLSESIEGTLLALPGRANHAWPDAVRRKELGRNYLEWTAELAEVPYASESRFYPSDAESAWAGEYLAKWKRDEVSNVLERLPEHFTILWVLSGSSQHKFYPHMDAVIARILLDMPGARIILSGDGLCELLEAGWQSEPRIKCESGHLSIRETLTLAQRVDLVIGPETGVLNGVAFESNAKVVILSHSSVENLTKHWVNTTAIMPFKTPCYPCHRLHYTREFCPEDMATGASKCAASIDPGVVAHTVLAYYEELCPMRTTLTVGSYVTKEAA